MLRRDEAETIPLDLDYSLLSGLSNEILQKLEHHRPVTIAQAMRIDGVTPAAILLLLANLKAARKARDELRRA